MRKHGSTFYCFSPQVMLATFFIEVGLVFYTLYTKKLNPVAQRGVLLITLLAIFQLTEYGVCEQVGITTQSWSKIGFTAITLLPPLGLHIAYSVIQKRADWLVYGAYLLALGWIGYFLFGNIMNGAVCGGNYVIFKIPNPQELLYYIYYDGIILSTIVAIFFFRYKQTQKKVRAALLALALGYASFILPSIIFTIIDNQHNHGDSPLPSILCGFAVFFALILTFSVIPKSSKSRL